MIVIAKRVKIKMKFEKFLLATAGICGVVGVHGHESGHHHDEKEIPLHEQEYIQDSAEELERKWSFEVRLKPFAL